MAKKSAKKDSSKKERTASEEPYTAESVPETSGDEPTPSKDEEKTNYVDKKDRKGKKKRKKQKSEAELTSNDEADPHVNDVAIATTEPVPETTVDEPMPPNDEEKTKSADKNDRKGKKKRKKQKSEVELTSNDEAGPSRNESVPENVDEPAPPKDDEQIKSVDKKDRKERKKRKNEKNEIKSALNDETDPNITDKALGSTADSAPETTADESAPAKTEGKTKSDRQGKKKRKKQNSETESSFTDEAGPHINDDAGAASVESAPETTADELVPLEDKEEKSTSEKGRKSKKKRKKQKQVATDDEEPVVKKDQVKEAHILEPETANEAVGTLRSSGKKDELPEDGKFFTDELEKPASPPPEATKKDGFFSFRKSKEARESGSKPAATTLLENITAPLAAAVGAIPDAVSDAAKTLTQTIPDAFTAIPDAVSDAAKTLTQTIPDAFTATLVGTLQNTVEQLELLTHSTEEKAVNIRVERDNQLLELYARTADFSACAERANALVWQRGLTPDDVITTAELHPEDREHIVKDLQHRVQVYEAEIDKVKARALESAIQRAAQAAINRELQDVRLKKASNAIREENRFRKALALQASKLTGLKEQIATARRVTREMKHAHLAIEEEHFDFGNELLKIREEARVLAIEDRDAHARHIYKTFQELLDESRNLKTTKGNERNELESLLRAFRQLDDLSTHQHHKMHEFYFQPFSECLQQTQAIYRDLLMQEEFRSIGKLPDELFTDIAHASTRYNELEIDHAIRLEEEARDTLLKALRTTLDSLSDESNSDNKFVNKSVVSNF